MKSPVYFKRFKSIFSKKESEQAYEPVETEYDSVFNDNDLRRPVLIVPDDELPNEQPFSWLEYSIFLLLGIAMLWSWNMFLAAAPYFQSRFSDNKAILARFQSAITSISCVTTFISTIVLTQLQLKANYPRRITTSLIILIVSFSLLTISTLHFRNISTEVYFTFTLIMVFSSSLATGLCQNGSFAFAACVGRTEYIQAIMTGQGIAGVLPAIAQIMSVLTVSDHRNDATPTERITAVAEENASAAFTYFITATAVSFLTLLTVIPLLRKHNRILRFDTANSFSSFHEVEGSKRQKIGMWTLYKKLHWLAASIFLCFAISMFFPVFTERIVSVVPEDVAPPILRRTAFIPLGFLSWNIGDLLGRLATLGPLGRWRIKPKNLFILVCLRAIFIPLYFLCNLGGNGAKVMSDSFYLIVVSGGFGVTNGLLSSICLMIAGSHVAVAEREATGGFMVANLLAGLMVGSLLSFALSGVGT